VPSLSFSLSLSLYGGKVPSASTWVRFRRDAWNAEGEDFEGMDLGK
jgi:hypothetical protein